MDRLTARVDEHFRQHQRAVERAMGTLYPVIVAAARLCREALDGGNKILLCGNGGSAADAQHIAAEFTGRYLRERRGLAAIALTTDSSALTAIGNDFGFEQVFARQLEALARPGDVLLAYSTSGQSPNVLAAVAAAGRAHCRVVALSGRDGGALAAAADVAIVAPAEATPHIQEIHGIVGHLICDLVDNMDSADAGQGAG